MLFFCHLSVTSEIQGFLRLDRALELNTRRKNLMNILIIGINFFHITDNQQNFSNKKHSQENFENHAKLKIHF